MVKIKVHSYKRDKSVIVDVANVSDENYNLITEKFLRLLKKQKAFQAIAEAYIYAVELCLAANPSDIWQHIIYRIYIDEGNNEQSWKRASGQGFEYAFAQIYNPRLAVYGIRLVILSKNSAEKALQEMKLDGKIEPSKYGYCD